MARRKTLTVLGAVAAILVLALGGFWVYLYFDAGTADPTRQVQAQRVTPEEPTTEDESRSVIYGAVAGESEARFLIDEVLRGAATTVVGRTDQIDGSIAIRLDPGRIEIGEFEINLRSIVTDNQERDRVIRSMILETNRDEFEFSTFVPQDVTGTPERIQIGDQVLLDVTGDLTVRDVTREVTFEMQLTVHSEEEITGVATTSFTWDEFDISIPFVGGNSIVSAVDDTVRIEMEFLAVAE